MALVLTRKVGQAVVLQVDGRRIRVKVFKVGENWAKLTFEADECVGIRREEIAPGPDGEAPPEGPGAGGGEP
jgi:carbon storage regulator CsrA